MTHPSLETLRDLAPGYLLQALNDLECQQFEHALRDPVLGPTLERELAAHRETFAALALGTATPPPPALRARVVARMVAEAESSAGSGALAPSISATQKPPRPLRVRWVPAVLVAALAASAVFVVDLRRQVDGLETRLIVQRDLLDSTRLRLAEREATLQILTDGGNDLVLVRLSPNTRTGPALQVYWNPRKGKAVVHASGLAPLAADRAYCLWMIRDGKPLPVTCFRPGANGSQLLPDITVATGTAGVAAFAVTEEAATGSPVPTMTPFLVGEVKVD
ncbi:anti-sigma factor [Gemmatimonas sp.]